MPDVRTERQEAFLHDFAQLIRTYSDVVGPSIPEDEPENGRQYTAEEIAAMIRVKNAALNQWIILTSWTDLDDGEEYLSAYCLPGMPTYHRLGMLSTWFETWK